MKRIYNFILLVCLVQLAVAQNRIAEIRENLLGNYSDRVLVVSHRADWRNAPENSLQGIRNCIDMGVDMVEIDLKKTKDGHLVVMHDKTINRTMNEVFETVAEVLEELRSESGEREYSVCTKEAKNAAKELKKANQEYEKLLAEISGEQRELLEKYMDIVDHAHFQEEQRAYYQGMIDAIQIFEGLGILKKRNKVKELLMHTEK